MAFTDVLLGGLGAPAAKKVAKSQKAKDFLFGTDQKITKAPTATPEQEELLKLIHQGLISGEGPFKDIFGGFNADEFKKGVSDPAMKQFREEILPAIQEKYLYAAGGSGLERNTTKAGVDLQSRLAELMYNAQQGQKNSRNQGLQTALAQKPFENIVQGEKSGAVQSLLKGVGEGVGKAGAMAIAG